MDGYHAKRLPSGFRFVPHDYELIVDYLMRKIKNQPLPIDDIWEVKLYEHDPHTLTQAYPRLGDNDWYFFTPRDKKYPNGTRPNRAAGSGFWKATGSDKDIKFGDIDVGVKKSLVFYDGKPPKGVKTDWIMHEYRINNLAPRIKIDANDMKLDDWVLCRVYKKPSKQRNDNNRRNDNNGEGNNRNDPFSPVQVEEEEENAVVDNGGNFFPMVEAPQPIFASNVLAMGEQDQLGLGNMSGNALAMVETRGNVNNLAAIMQARFRFGCNDFDMNGNALPTVETDYNSDIHVNDTAMMGAQSGYNNDLLNGNGDYLGLGGDFLNNQPEPDHTSTYDAQNYSNLVTSLDRIDDGMDLGQYDHRIDDDWMDLGQYNHRIDDDWMDLGQYDHRIDGDWIDLGDLGMDESLRSPTPGIQIPGGSDQNSWDFSYIHAMDSQWTFISFPHGPSFQLQNHDQRSFQQIFSEGPSSHGQNHDQRSFQQGSSALAAAASTTLSADQNIDHSALAAAASTTLSADPNIDRPRKRIRTCKIKHRQGQVGPSSKTPPGGPPI